MTDRATLLALVAKVESAEGPSRDLDREVALAAGWRRAPNEYGDDTPWLIAPGQEVGPWERHSPPFTASLDAALSLPHKGFIAALSELAADGLPGCCICTDTTTSPPTEVWGVCYTAGPVVERLARAATAAALRAIVETQT